MAQNRKGVPGQVGATHHHHEAGADCIHGRWATDTVDGHHHHERATKCIHGLWATDSVNGHHHHKRSRYGTSCAEHHDWATSEDELDNVVLTAGTSAEDPSIVYDLSQSDARSYKVVAAELAEDERRACASPPQAPTT